MSGPEATPAASVIIPTHNRSALLAQVLDALRRGREPIGGCEIVVVADGCVDGTADLVRNLARDLPIVLVELEGLGPAVARNAGARVATAPLLVFLDDDVEPGEDFLVAHIEAHRAQPGVVVLGPYPPLPHASSSYFRLNVRQWWTQQFIEVAKAGRRFRYTDVLTGNLSMAAGLWHEIGALDPAFRKAREDYELGLRVLAAEIPVVFEPAALAWHREHETMTLDATLRRVREEAWSDILLVRKHPQIAQEIAAVRWRQCSSLASALRDHLLFVAGRPGDRLAQAAPAMLRLLDRLRMRQTYMMLFRMTRAYWYIAGLRKHFPSFAAWRAFAAGFPAPDPEPFVTLDLREGLAAAETWLDRVRPEGVRLRHGRHPVGTLPTDPGAERVRGAHLRPWLAGEAAPAYLRALAREGAIGGTGTPSRRLLHGLAATARHYGARTSSDAMLEQFEQWGRAGHAGGDPPQLPVEGDGTSSQATGA